MKDQGTWNVCNTNTKKIPLWEQMSFCIQKDITIYPVPVENSRGEFKPDCYIHVNKNGKVIISPKTYKQDIKLYDKIMELYSYYYEKLWT